MQHTEAKSAFRKVPNTPVSVSSLVLPIRLSKPFNSASFLPRRNTEVKHNTDGLSSIDG